MKNLSWWTVMGVGLISASLAGCGGGSGSDSGNLRVVNATLTHASLDLIKNSDSSKLVSATAIDTVSGSVGVSSSGETLQITDSGNTTALATVAPSIAGGQHSAMVVYESSGAIKAAFLGEDFTVPAAGTAQLKVFDAATDAGPVDVYVVAPAVDVTTTTPTFSLTAASVQASGLASFTPGNYHVRVTGQGSKTDVRLDIPSITLTSATVNTLILTPTTGGLLVNGSTLVQQAATYTVSRNTNARVRVVAGIPGNASVAVSAGSTSLATALSSPTAGSSYALVPGSSAAVTTTATVAGTGATASAPVTFAVGKDYTVLVSGTAAAPAVSAFEDDNHLPTSNLTAKVRLINGLSETGGASLQVGYAQVASNIASPGASAYGLFTFSPSTTAFKLTSSVANVTTTLSDQPALTTGVYTFYLLGNAASPVYLFLQDR